jgi:rod shape-determining protein MreC
VGPFRRYRDIALVILLLAVPFFFLRASVRNPEEMNVIDRTLVRFSAPIEYAASALARGASSLVSDYVYLVDVKADNNKLMYENARLRQTMRRMSAAEAENRRLKRLLALRESVKDETVSAVVIGKDTTEYFRVWHVTLDNPAPGILPNMPVLSFDGTVGTVLRVAGEKVDVQLTVDSGFGVDVIVERTGARGFVRGVGDTTRYMVRVEYVQRTDEVEQGDILVTSGYGCRFPKGVPVARVTDVVKRDFGIYQQVEAVPTVDFSRLEEVLIVLRDTNECAPPTSKDKRAGR